MFKHKLQVAPGNRVSTALSRQTLFANPWRVWFSKEVQLKEYFDPRGF